MLKIIYISTVYSVVKINLKVKTQGIFFCTVLILYGISAMSPVYNMLILKVIGPKLTHQFDSSSIQAVPGPSLPSVTTFGNIWSMLHYTFFSIPRKVCRKID